MSGARIIEGLREASEGKLGRVRLENGETWVKAFNPWQPIKTAPKDVEVLVGLWLSQRRWFQIVAEKVSGDAGRWIADSGRITLAPTHWTHLPPEPPVPA